MSDVNTVSDVIFRQNNSQPIVLTLATQGHFQFLLGAGPAVATVPNPMALIDSGVAFPGRSAQALPLLIRAAGLISSNARGQVVQIDINQGTGLSPAIATTGLQTIPTGAGTYTDNWLMEIEGLWDATSQNLRGIVYGYFGPNNIAQATIVNSAPAALANLQFNVGVTWPGPTVLTTTLTLTELSVSIA